MNIIGVVVSYAYIALVIGFAKLVEKYGKEASRKFIHILLGNWWIIAMIFFDNVVILSLLVLSMVILNYISCKKDIIKVMERDEEKKDGYGTVYYAISLLIISIVTFGILHKPILGLVPVLVMAYGDGLAAIIGKKVKSKKYKVGNSEKSIAGSLTMFIISFIMTLTYFIYEGTPYGIIKAIIISIIVTILEAVSIKGTDNITVPLGMLLMIAVSVL